MSKWTLRGYTPRFEYRGQRQDHPAALRAQRYVRRHAWQFHGAGVRDTAAALPGINAVLAIRNALAALVVSMNVPGPLVLDYDDTPLLPETAHGLTVVGWLHEEIRYLCADHRLPGAVPLTASYVTASTECAVCGTRLLG